jgi:hypothetical protein
VAGVAILVGDRAMMERGGGAGDRITCVIEFFDDEREIPWHYVMRGDGGTFEAIVTELFDGITSDADNQARDRVLGVFETEQEAIKAIWKYRDCVNAALYEVLDDSLPTIQ